MGKIYRNKNMLSFLYHISHAEENLSVRRMSQLVLDNGKTISEPTIKTWFRQLKQERKFYYYPITDYEAFGLVPVTETLANRAA